MEQENTFQVQKEAPYSKRLLAVDILGLCKSLWRRGNVNAQLVEHSNALQGASEGGHIEVARMLIEKEADVNTGNFVITIQDLSLHRNRDLKLLA